MGDILENVKGFLVKYALIIVTVSTVSIIVGYVWDDAYFGFVGLWVVLLGILLCLLIIVFENAMQIDIVEEQLMELNREVVRWRESQNQRKKRK